MKVKYKKLTNAAKEPFRANPGDAGADLFAVESVEILPGQSGWVGTGISVEIPEGYYGRIAPRSGLAFKKGINVLAGVIDTGYRGELRVGLHNTNLGPYLFRPVERTETLTGLEGTVKVAIGDKIAQLIIEKIADYVEFEEVRDLEGSERGVGGFGSSDSKKIS